MSLCYQEHCQHSTPLNIYLVLHYYYLGLSPITRITKCFLLSKSEKGIYNPIFSFHIGYQLSNYPRQVCMSVLNNKRQCTSSVVNYDSATTFYNLVIRASDSVNNVDVPVAVTLSPVNEATPTFSQSPKTVSFAEDTAVGTVLDTFVAADSDYAPHSIVSYGITAGMSSNRFRIYVYIGLL